MGAPFQGRCPASEVNDGGCPRKPDHLSDGVRSFTQLIDAPGDTEIFATTSSDGSIYLASYSTLEGIGDYFTKYNNDGTKAWTRLLESTSPNYPSRITTASDGCIYQTGVAGTYPEGGGYSQSPYTDAFITKYNSEGSKEWTSIIGLLNGDCASLLTTGRDGSIVLAGTTRGNLDGQINGGEEDAFIVKYNSDGVKEWTKLLGSTSYDSASCITTASDGSIYLAGSTGGNLDGQINRSEWGDSFITKYYSDGTKAWTQLLGSSGGGANFITTDSEGSIYLAGPGGEFDGQTIPEVLHGDYFLAKYSSDGTKVWTQSVVSLLLESFSSFYINDYPVNISSDGSVYLSGVAYSDRDAPFVGAQFIAKYTVSTTAVSAQSGITTSSSTFNEKISDNSTVATLFTNDPNFNDTITYSLVSGDGDNDNSAFFINGDEIVIKKSPDAEDKSYYKIRIRSSNQFGLYYVKEILLYVLKINEAPTDVTLSRFGFDENISSHTEVATLSTVDPDSRDTHIYALVAGNRDTDNSLFSIHGNQLLINDSPDYEKKASYQIRIRTRDQDGLELEKELNLTVNDLQLEKQWTKLLGSTSYDSTSCITTASDGSIYLAGSTGGNLDGHINNGYSDAFITKYSTDGAKSWSQLIGTSNYDYAASITTASDGSIYIAGITFGNLDGLTNSDGGGDVFVIKYNNDSTKAWTQLLSTSRNSRPSITNDDNGYIFLAGTTLGDLDGQINSGAEDAFITKYNNDGTKVWTRLLGSPSADHASSVTTAGDGSIYLAGRTQGNLDGQVNSGGDDIFITKYNSEGAKEWTRLIGSTLDDLTYSLSTAWDGSIYLAGTTQGTLDGQINSGGEDAFIVKYNSDGTKVWTKILGSSSNDYATSVITAGDGSIYLAGTTQGNIFKGNNYGSLATFIAKYNSNGDREWVENPTVPPTGRASVIAYASDGSIYLGGSTYYGLDGLINAGLGDAYIAKYTPSYDDSAAPTDISSTALTFNENISAHSSVATFSTTDPDSGDTFSYALVAGDGDIDNTAFTISGDQLLINESPDLEAKYSYSIRIQSRDQDGLSYTKALTLSVLNVNEAPTDLTLTSNGIKENSAAGTLIGTLSAVDPDAGTSFSYALVAGNGINDADNNLVEIVGDQVKVKAGASIDFETNPVLNLNIQVTDNGTPSLSYSKAVTAAVLNVNEAPTNLTASTTAFNENITAGSTVVTLSSSDPDASNIFIYSLVSGTGSTDNSAFSIIGNQLKINASPDFETKSSYSIRVRTTDQGGLLFEKNMSFTVNNLNEAPTNLTASTTAFNENITAGSTVVTLSSSDPDVSNIFIYSLVSGTGSTDNSAFSIIGNQLKINASPDFETKTSYSIRVRTTDQGGLLFEKNLTFSVNNLTETVSSSTTTTLALNKDTLLLTGSSNINGTGNNANNTITGNSGNNILDGGTGADTLIGGAGNDTYIVDTAGDVVTEASGTGSGTDLVKASINYTLGANLENLTLTGTTAINGTGNALNNTITGNTGANILDGGAGKDILTGLGGADTFRYTTLTNSLLSGYDRITDFAVGTDFIDGPNAIAAASVKKLGSVSALTQSAIQEVLTSTNFVSKGASIFTFVAGASTQRFLALNDATPGFNASNDAIIEITGLNGDFNKLSLI